MKAMIFAAGLGTRLKPLTNDKPKALVPFLGKPMIDYCIRNLARFGFNEIVINIHHYAEDVRKYILSQNYHDIRIEFSDEYEQLLDTGGGLKKAAWFFSDKPFLVHNVDIISNIDLTEVYNANLKSNALATLAVTQTEADRYLYFNNDQQLVAWKNVMTGEEKVARPSKVKIPFSFCGIQVIQPRIFPILVEEGVFSIIDVYLRLAKENNIEAWFNSEAHYYDLGTPGRLAGAEMKLIDEETRFRKDLD